MPGSDESWPNRPERLLGSTGWQAWVLLLAWGVFRNSPFPVTYALLIDSTPQAAG